MADPDPHAVAARALPLLDLTDLSDDCDVVAIEALCRRAVTAHGSVAAVCIWPRFVARARDRLAGTGVRVATVVNFPHGGEDVSAVVAETEQAIADGADEIDLVMPYAAVKEGRTEAATNLIARVREAVRSPVRLKVILETGELADDDLIASAADLAIAAGADFIKTSTGKVSVNATLEAARIMLERIAVAGRGIGFKPAGGIRTVQDAAAYLALADEIVGTGWATPDTFRFGASGLLDALLAELDGTGAPSRGGGGY